MMPPPKIDAMIGSKSEGLPVLGNVPAPGVGADSYTRYEQEVGGTYELGYAVDGDSLAHVESKVHPSCRGARIAHQVVARPRRLVGYGVTCALVALDIELP